MKTLQSILAIALLLFVIATTEAQNNSGAVKDIDGNVYKTIKIGNQVWMAENLKTTKLNDGQPIPLVKDNMAWTNLETPGYCFYNNDSTKKDIYGALYNWYAVKTGKLAPKGWHVATDAEWEVLTEYLGGKSVAGRKLKEIGFIVNGAGNRDGGRTGNDGSFNHIDLLGRFWTSSFGDRGIYYWTIVTKNEPDMDRSTHRPNVGKSVRCVKDN